jgi:hypothetical protein
MADRALEIVRELPDGTFVWRGPLSAPGAGGPAALAVVTLSDAFGATEFEITAAGDWIATVEGVRYNVLPGVVPDTGEFVFIGVPTEGDQQAARVWGAFGWVEARQ